MFRVPMAEPMKQEETESLQNLYLDGQDRVYVTADQKILLFQADGTYKGAVKTDWYGRSMPRSLNKSMRLERPTSSSSVLIDTLLKLCDEFLDRRLTVRRINISLSELKREDSSYQPTLFDESADEKKLERERRLQEATLRIKDRWGRNAILRALDYTDGATQRDRNNQIGGHKA